MRVLIVGGGGREHAFVRAVLGSPSVSEIFVAPGNPGIATEPRTTCIDVSSSDVDALVDFARKQAIELTIVGPEAPLVLGLVDALTAAGLNALGPTAAAAEIEGSKDFAKRVMRACGVATADWSAHRTLESARRALPDGPVVVKADGLASGKGVFVCDTREEALAALVKIFDGTPEVVALIEERLSGEEVSVIALCDGEDALLFPPAQDHKRLLEGDRGPKTGGMGACAPTSAIDAAGLGSVQRDILRPVLREMASRGSPFRGFLYAGLMLTPRGPMVLEFNARFGDPEAQVLLALLACDPVPAFLAAASGRLEGHDLRFRPGAAACVVMAAKGYPDKPERGAVIEGLKEASLHADILHAGTRLDEAGRLLADGGRVLGVTVAGSSLADALSHALRACDCITFDGSQHRRDIGARELERPSL